MMIRDLNNLSNHTPVKPKNLDWENVRVVPNVIATVSAKKNNTKNIKKNVYV